MSLRRITSLTLLASFLLLVLTSVILYIMPQGRVAYWSDWHLWGLSKTEWGSLHLNLGVLMLLAGLLHIWYNWKPIVAYFKNRARELRLLNVNSVAALVLTLAVAVGTWLEVPPMSTIVEISDAFKDAAAEKYGEPPYGHAELSSLRMFTRKEGLDLEKSLALLEAAGVAVTGDRQPIVDIARTNRMTPQQVYEVIRPAGAAGAGAMLPDAPPPGFGRKTLAEVCEAYQLDLPDMVRALSERGISAAPNQSIREIAEKNGMAPMALFEILRESAGGA